MGTYREEIQTAYGTEEAKRRINEWLRTDGKKYKIRAKDETHLGLKRGVAMNPDIYFNLRLTSNSVRAECWTQAMTEDPISPDAVWGAISRRTGWKDFQSLKAALLHGHNSSALQ